MKIAMVEFEKKNITCIEIIKKLANKNLLNI